MHIESNTGNLDIKVKFFGNVSFHQLKDDLVSSLIIPDDKSDNHLDYDHCCQILIKGVPKIHYFLNTFSTGLQDIQLLYIDETSTLMIGGKSSSVAFNVNEDKISNRFQHALFWQFRLTPDKRFILDEGELDSVLRKPNGEIIKSVSIDPPYESEYIDGGIEYDCIVMGKVQMLFPS